MYKIPAKTLFLGKKLIYVPQCHSTNSLASELSQKENVLDGTIIITDHQTEGRGQRGNSWESEAGKNLTFTIIVKPIFLDPRDQFYLNMVVSLGITDYLDNLLNRASLIKWPNDILYNLKKLGGILIENQISGSRITTSLIGIGLNVNQELFKAPGAGSILSFTGASVSLEKEFEDVLSFIERRYIQLKNGNKIELKAIYLERLFGMNEWREYRVQGKLIRGKIEGIDQSGRVIFSSGDELKSYGLKEIEFVF